MFSDADRQKPISYSCSTLQKTYNYRKKHFFLCIFTGPLPRFQIPNLHPKKHVFKKKYFFKIPIKCKIKKINIPPGLSCLVDAANFNLITFFEVIC